MPRLIENYWYQTTQQYMNITADHKQIQCLVPTYVCRYSLIISSYNISVNTPAQCDRHSPRVARDRTFVVSLAASHRRACNERNLHSFANNQTTHYNHVIPIYTTNKLLPPLSLAKANSRVSGVLIEYMSTAR